MTNLINIAKETTCTFQVNHCDFEVTTKSNGKVERIKITGLIIKPNWIEVKPSYFRSQIIKRKDLEPKEAEKISEDLLNGNYYLNIKDYTDQELQIASDYLTSRWTDMIWSKLTQNDNDIIVTLKDEVVWKHILKENNELFKTKLEFDEFCQAKGLKLSDFIISGNFSSLEHKLQEISIRLEMEQFFARRFLFTQKLISKLNFRLSSYSQNNSLAKGKKSELEKWIKDLKANNSSYIEYENLQKLYEMPKQNIKIKGSKNVTFVNGEVNDSTIHSGDSKSGIKSSKLKMIGIALAIVVAIMEIIIYWNDIIKIFEK
ncbi:hypothetical protein [Christiangramia sp.]|uniref:hypothetical protein n=1 Tax=Christiangramia sp. TaxID=1931228 RepID=UPI00260A97FC|nr:hypothetical protein [Christiangramia sp.]